MLTRGKSRERNRVEVEVAYLIYYKSYIMDFFLSIRIKYLKFVNFKEIHKDNHSLKDVVSTM
jgi:hypothetical protein